MQYEFLDDLTKMNLEINNNIEDEENFQNSNSI